MRVCLLSETNIAEDPRIRRQGNALSEAGYDVVAIGARGAATSQVCWPIVQTSTPSRSLTAKVSTTARTQVVRLTPGLARPVYWSFPSHRRMRRTAHAFSADVYHANDWRVLPLAAELAAKNSAQYVYDSHEYAVEENASDPLWRVTFPPYVRAIESRYIERAAAVTTVGDGIADLLTEKYSLRRRPTVIRNVPDYQPMPFRRVSGPIDVLYHGMFNADRGLLELVSSVAKWSPNMRLTLRGFGAPSMEQRLRDAANEAGVTDRVRFEPRAPMLELVALANQSDVGIHPIPVANQQTNLCLPNKFFEYVMAGLAVCVSDAREMAQLTHNYDVGVTFESSDAGSIANAVNSLTPARVEAFKRSALEAAKELNWEHEKLKLLDVYRSLR